MNLFTLAQTGTAVPRSHRLTVALRSAGSTMPMHTVSCLYFVMNFPQRGWAAPRSSAILGQPVEGAKQASVHLPGEKN